VISRNEAEEKEYRKRPDDFIEGPLDSKEPPVKGSYWVEYEKEDQISYGTTGYWSLPYEI
jgi:hypothetical protein